MQLLEIARKTIEKAEMKGASQAEATVVVADSALTRFTRNAIHQNVAQRKYNLNLEVVVNGNRRGSTALNSLNDADIDESLNSVMKIAKVSTPDPDFVSLPEPLEIAPLPEIYNRRTAGVTPEDRVDGVQSLIETALDHDKRVRWSTGAYTMENCTYAMANSLGVEAETAYTRASVDIVVKAGGSEDGSGYSAKYSRDVGDFDFEAMARSAAEDAVKSVGPELIPTGEYEAVFTPVTVSTFTGFMGRLGFSARAHQDGYSCLTDKIGSQVFDEKLTINDMGRSLATFNAMPFDGEGVPKGTLRLVNRGVPENLCYDSYTALKDGLESTGHALPKSGGFFFRGMPLPLNMVVESGDATVEEMIEDTKKGVYLTRLHYVNAIRRDLAVISGLTRDACWLIEDGEVKHPIKVMRFTDSVIRVMSGIDAIGDNSTVEMLPYGTLPAIKVSSFRFTGQSEF